MNGSNADLPTAAVASLDESAALACRASAQMLRSIAAIDEQQLWIEDGATSMTSWLAARYFMAWGGAREWVRIARAFPSLRAIRDAFGAGLLSFDQLKPLTRFVNEQEDERWARKAQELSPTQL